MEISIVFTTLLAFATESPHLCDTPLLDAEGEPYVDATGQVLSRDCQWTGPGSPIWGADICCSIDAAGAACEVMSPDLGTCATGLDPYFCERGEPTAGGGFVCYQEFPDACERGFCQTGAPPPIIEAPEGSTEEVICCVGGACWPWEGKGADTCQGEFAWCDDGYSKEDGTVECFD